MNLTKFSWIETFALYLFFTGFLSAANQSDDISFVRNSPVKPQLNTQDLQASSSLPKPEKESSSVLIQASASKKSSDEAWNQVCIEECRQLKMKISQIKSEIDVKDLTQRTLEQFYHLLDEYESHQRRNLNTVYPGTWGDYYDRMRGGAYDSDDETDQQWKNRWMEEQSAKRAKSDIDIQNLTSYVKETLIRARSAIPVMIEDLVYHQIDQDTLPSWVLPCIGDPRILDNKEIWSMMAKSLKISLDKISVKINSSSPSSKFSCSTQ